MTPAVDPVADRAVDSEADRAAVAALLGREPEGDFAVVVRHLDGGPVVIRNAPLLPSGRPMPTRYWLVGEPERTWVGRLESAGGVDRSEAEVDAATLELAHRRHAAERDAALPPGHTGPRPAGGVAGTRRGVKCLHAHYAWWLAGGEDPVGAWVAEHLDEVGGGAPGSGGPPIRNFVRVNAPGSGGPPVGNLVRVNALGAGPRPKFAAIPEEGAPRRWETP